MLRRLRSITNEDVNLHQVVASLSLHSVGGRRGFYGGSVSGISLQRIHTHTLRLYHTIVRVHIWHSPLGRSLYDPCIDLMDMELKEACPYDGESIFIFAFGDGFTRSDRGLAGVGEGRRSFT